MPKQQPPLKERILAKIKVDKKSGCWNWTGKINVHGYACFRYGRSKNNTKRRVEVHRVSYQEFNGPILPGLVIDHLCRNKKCVNPKHLEAITSGENVLRGVGPTAMNARKTHCMRGHKLLGKVGSRSCQTCIHDRDKIRQKEARIIREQARLIRLVQHNAEKERRKEERLRNRKTHCDYGHELTGSYIAKKDRKSKEIL